MLELSDSLLRAEFLRRFTLKRGEVITGSSLAARHFQARLMDESSQERFLICFLTHANQVITCQEHCIGSISSSVIHPREVLKQVLQYDASAIILAHNHPSGTLEPSREDKDLTKTLIKALKTINVTVHDHIIVAYGNQDYFSFADHGII